MTDTENKNWAFLSYSPQDNRAHRSELPAADNLCWGDWLHDALKTFSIPAEFIGQINGRGEIIPQRIEGVFRNTAELETESALSADVRTALEQSICLIVICSPRSAKSIQVNEAVRYFKQLGRGQQILPIVIAGEPYVSEGNAAREDECFVPTLRHPVSPEGTIDLTRRAGKAIFVDARHNGREILAGDTRHAEADLEMAKIQLIALLLGVGFNGLWQREQKRHFFDLADAQHQVRDALNQVTEVQIQLQTAQQQVRAAQNQALENQNLPREVQGQIQEAQNQARLAEDQARETQKQLQEFQNKVRETQLQLEEASQRARAAESKVLEAQQQARETLEQLEATRQQARAAQPQVLETPAVSPEVPEQILAAQNQLEDTRQQVQDAEKKFLAAQSQVQELQERARVTQAQLEAAQQQVRAAESKIQATPNQVPPIANQSGNARRLMKVFAILTVLALMSAGLAINTAMRQRKLAEQALAKVDAATNGVFDFSSGDVITQPIQQMLQKIGGAERTENQRRTLDALAAGIPQTEIAEALKASAVIVNDQPRSHFQKWLLIRLGWENPLSAMTNASAIEEKIVTDEGANDSCLYFQLAVLDNWLATDFSGAFNWVGQLPDADSRQRALEKVIAWVKSQPDSEAKNNMLATCLDELAKINAPSIMQPQTDAWPWTKFFLNSTLGGLIVVPVETEILSSPTNGAGQIKANE